MYRYLIFLLFYDELFLGIIEQDHISSDFTDEDRRKKMIIRGMRVKPTETAQDTAAENTEANTEVAAGTESEPLTVTETVSPGDDNDMELDENVELDDALDDDCIDILNGNEIVPDINNSFSEDDLEDFDSDGRRKLPSRAACQDPVDVSPLGHPVSLTVNTVPLSDTHAKVPPPVESQIPPSVDVEHSVTETVNTSVSPSHTGPHPGTSSCVTMSDSEQLVFPSLSSGTPQSQTIENVNLSSPKGPRTRRRGAVSAVVEKE